MSSSKGSCDFEDGSLCGYENDIENTGKWEVNMARDFKGVKVAPSVDTTTGLPSGHLMFLIGGDYDVNAMVVSEVKPRMSIS